MSRLRNNYAFIDGQNLYQGIKAMGWNLDYRRFRRLLLERYGIEKAFICIGYVPANAYLYAYLQDMGFTCIFKPTLKVRDGTIKGNVDAELVLHTMIEKDHFDKVLIVTGDGDFHCLVEYLVQVGKLERLLVPNRFRYSALLKRAAGKHIDFMNDLQQKLAKKEKDPARTEP